MVAEKDSKGGITYAGQDKLKKLPIPKLDDTVRNYLAAVEPLQV